MGIFVDWLITSKGKDVEQLAFNFDTKFSIDADEIRIKDEKAEHEGKFVFIRYCWTTIEPIAKEIFSKGKAEMSWAEDMWNILMFNAVVKLENLYKPSYNQMERGDIILWLMAMYNFYYEFKVASGLCKLINYDYFDGVYFIEDSMIAIGEFLSEEIKREVNDKISRGISFKHEIFDLENQCFNFEPGAIAYNLCVKEISERREVIISAINMCCNEPMDILKFMDGNHWCENYFNYNEKEDEIISCYKEIKARIKRGVSVTHSIGQAKVEYVDEEDANEYMEKEIEELKLEMKKFILSGDEANRLMWLDNGMKLQ